ncbi:hypothetical protein GCM10027449_26700 [Sinomonas notoginsengisoli]|uniref:hypothetical protein n=1 Tax=Sinomonas notoginsengisoli TaxID=1457311 RepID=UPI001F44AAD1|nr:hypothetical protein [Sinomonas notoginsengisoli]
MGFKDEIGRLDSSRDEALRRASDALEENRRRNAEAVVAEIRQSLSDAVDYLSAEIPDSAASLVVHSGPETPRRKLFGKPETPRPYSNPRVLGRCWPADSGWVITDSAQLLRTSLSHWPSARKYTPGYPPDQAALAAGLADSAPYALVAEGSERHLLDPDVLIVVTEDGWGHDGPRAGGWWTSVDRNRYAAILDGPYRRGAHYGITPSGKAAAVSVTEADNYADGNQFRMTAYQLDTWLAATLHRRVNEARATGL